MPNTTLQNAHGAKFDEPHTQKPILRRDISIKLTFLRAKPYFVTVVTPTQATFLRHFHTIGIIPLVMLALGCAVGTKQIASPSGVPLDQAIREAAVSIDERVEAGTKIALLNFNSPSEQFSLYVLDELTANLVDSRKLTVVDRKELYLIRDEFAFQLSGDVEDNSMQELGRMLGAQSIVSGSLTEIGGSYRIVIRVLNVQSAAIVAQYRTDIAGDKRVSALLARRDAGGTATSGLSSGTVTASNSSGGGTTTIIVRPSPPPQRRFAAHAPVPVAAPAAASKPVPITVSVTASAAASKPAPPATPVYTPTPVAASAPAPTPTPTAKATKRSDAHWKNAGAAPVPASTPATNMTKRSDAYRKNAETAPIPASAPATNMTKRSNAHWKPALNESANAPAGASIFFKTLPTNADVYIGGRFIGTSNTGELQVPTGTHKVRFVNGDIDKTFTFTFESGKNKTQLVPLK